MQKIYYGIDFGNTNTTVVQLLEDPLENKIVPLGEDGQPFPSILAINKETGAVLYGREVKMRRQKLASDHVIITSFKSRLGTERVEKIAGKEYTALELTALLLRSIKDYIKRHNDIDIQEAVFSVPVDFNGKQRQELRLAAEQAGIVVKGFVSESTAAYIGCTKELAGYSKVAVFDWGGGTLDISVLEREGSRLKELAVSGKNLGGDKLDYILAQKKHGQLASQYALDTFDLMSAENRDNMLERCEKSKIDLSEEDFSRFNLIDYGTIKHARVSVDLNEFTQLITPQVKEAAQMLEDTLIQAECFAQLDAVLMVGGSSNIQAIRDIIESSFESKNIAVVHPDQAQWVAAKGAASIATLNSGYLLEQGIGVLLADDSFHPIIPKGTPVPCSSNEIRFGVVEDTTSANIIIVNDKKRHLRVETMPVKGFTSEGIKVSATIDEDLITTIKMESTQYIDNTKYVQLPSVELSYDLDIKIQKPNTPMPSLKAGSKCSYRDCRGTVYRDGYCAEHFRYERAASK